MQSDSIYTFTDKPHYHLLDGLRGVAALVVIWYHVFEGFATSAVDQGINHGYLAVDFFFMLSGFVIGYAYDDRWCNGRLTEMGFFRRRLIRLHPMLVMGVLLGAISFFVQGGVKWDGSSVAASTVFVAAILTMLFIPAIPGATYEVRGNGEMFPLNGPAWSLFFEYIGNILYALLLRRLSTKALACFVSVTGAGLAFYAISDVAGSGNLCVGWTLAGSNFVGGLLRLSFSFSAGLLMARVFRPVKVRGAFWICAITVVCFLSMPYLGDGSLSYLNGLYEMFCVMLVFPFVVYVGASGHTTDVRSAKVCKFLGDVSYPVYIVHYPLMYLYYAWVWRNGLDFARTWPVAVGVFAGSILLAYACLKLYDEPVRRWLSSRFK